MDVSNPASYKQGVVRLPFSGSPFRYGLRGLCCSMVLFVAVAARADNAAFDLIGPKFQVHVRRQGVTIPIAQVPNLQPGDRLWVHPDMPDTQSVHYLMVVVFLRGATN